MVEREVEASALQVAVMIQWEVEAILLNTRQEDSTPFINPLLNTQVNTPPLLNHILRNPVVILHKASLAFLVVILNNLVATLPLDILHNLECLRQAILHNLECLRQAILECLNQDILPQVVILHLVILHRYSPVILDSLVILRRGSPVFHHKDSLVIPDSLVILHNRVILDNLVIVLSNGHCRLNVHNE